MGSISNNKHNKNKYFPRNILKGLVYTIENTQMQKEEKLMSLTILFSVIWN